MVTMSYEAIVAALAGSESQRVFINAYRDAASSSAQDRLLRIWSVIINSKRMAEELTR